MPTWVLDGPIWERAKATVRERTDYEDLSGGAFYALVSTLYQRMGGRVKRRNARTKALGGSKEYPIRVRFDAENDHAYTDSRDASGAKLARRVFGTKRAQAMARIPAVIEHPRLRLRNHGADLLLEGRLHSEHYTVVLTWKEADVYVFDSAHFRSAREVLSLQRHQDHGKNNGPLQKE